MRKLSLALAALLCMQLSAASVSTAAEHPVSGRFSLGYTRSSGNTDESKANFTFDLAQQRNEHLKFGYKGLFLYSKADDVKTEDKKQFDFLSEFIKNDKFSWYANLGYMKDEFAGYDRQLKLGLGIINYFIKEPDRFFSGTVGIDYTRERYTDDTKHNETWLRLGLDGKTKLAENVYFTADVAFLAPKDDWKDHYRTESSVGLTFTINSRLDAEVKYMYDFNKCPVDGKDKVDRTFITAITYKI